MKNEIMIIEVQKEINRQLGNAETFTALLATTFKGLNKDVVKRAIMEGMLRGFTFKDFLEKNVYAIPYGNGYSLVSSIDYARKIGMRSGVVGKSAPSFTMDGKKLESCTITVKRQVEGVVGEWTATVFFDEYTTGKNLWNSKPRTMIAKVAEMHALRMACPEELSQTYAEEEFDKEREGDDYDHSDIPDNVVPVVSIGEDAPREHAPNLLIGEEKEIPTDEKEQKNLIVALIAKKFPETDLKDAKALKIVVADYTELEFVPKNYPHIIKLMR